MPLPATRAKFELVSSTYNRACYDKKLVLRYQVFVTEQCCNSMTESFETCETEPTEEKTTENTEANGKGDTQDAENLSSNNIKSKGGPSNEASSSPDELSHKVDTRSSQQSNRSSRVGMANKPLPELPQNGMRSLLNFVIFIEKCYCD